MIAAMFLLASAQTAVDAEYAFARDARRSGQWTAFRRSADKDAVMFTPQAVWARDFLANLKDPPGAVRWWPTHSLVSCDGRTAVNTGPWIDPDGKTHGFFTTVWQRTGKNWRWVYDGGERQTGPIPSRTRPLVHRASCSGNAPGAPTVPPPPLSSKQSLKTPVDNGRGQSADRSLGWDWKVDKNGGRKFRVLMWNGARYGQVLFNDIPPPVQSPQ